jgi:hypothetical protein
MGRRRELLFGILAVSVAACSSSNQSDDSSRGGAAANTCMSVCDRGHMLGCSDRPVTTYDHASCIGECTRIADMKADTDTCYPEANALVNCLNGLSDLCAGFELASNAGDVKACNTERSAYETCVSDYCADHTKQDYCN